MISYGRQSINEDDIRSVEAVLKSDFLTQGLKVTEFEKEICSITKAKYCIAVANGTAALHLAVLALDLPEGSRGITSANTFVASANCMTYAGLGVDFSDIEPRTYNVTTDLLKKCVTEDTSLIIPVHFAGQACDMVSIKSFADKFNLRIIEDASHAIGSEYADGSNVGSCKYSDLTTFSFHPVKTITTGEGGAITTNNEILYNRLLLLRSHGITKGLTLTKKNVGPWYYEMQELGYNYRLTDIQAALGISQIKRLSLFKKRRRELVYQYNDAFDELDWLVTPYESEGLSSCFHLYVPQIDFDRLKMSRAELMEHLLKKGIGTQVHYIPVHTQPYYRKKNKHNCPNSLNYYEKALSLPLFPDMTDEMQQQVIEAVKSLGV